jgi:RNA polymerase sigma-70 factor (ECF subfamily)
MTALAPVVGGWDLLPAPELDILFAPAAPAATPDMPPPRPDPPPAPPVLPRVARGDQAAVQECLDRYGRLVQGLARKWLGAGADADDAVQDVFIELWKQAGRYDPRASPELAFVALVARRRLIDRCRRRRTRPAEEPLVDLTPQPDEAMPTWEVEDQLAPVRAVLAELPAEQRRVLLLAVCDGATHPEIAAATGLPLGTVKTYIRRGLLFVRERLGELNRGGAR